jgi:hypothetical protein
MSSYVQKYQRRKNMSLEFPTIEMRQQHAIARAMPCRGQRHSVHLSPESLSSSAQRDDVHAGGSGRRPLPAHTRRSAFKHCGRVRMDSAARLDTETALSTFIHVWGSP